MYIFEREYIKCEDKLRKKNDIQFEHKYALYQGLKLIDYILLIRKFIQIYNLMVFFFFFYRQK
jgi:hypothetical protein